MDLKHKKIGIIGGVGPQASSYLYQQIMTQAQERYCATENDDFPRVILYSEPVPDFISSSENIPQARLMLEKVVRDLHRCEVDRIVIASNTVHLMLEELKKQTQIKYISMISAVADSVEIDGVKVVGLLASPTTIRLGLYEKYLAGKKIKLVTPKLVEQKKVEKMIRNIIAGQANEGIKKEYVIVINSLFSRGAEAVILGCTELPCAINYEALGNRVYDSMKILAEKIVDYYYN